MFGESVTFIAGPRVDKTGAALPGAADFVVPGCILDWTGSTDIEQQGRQAMSSNANIFIDSVPPGFDVGAYDTVRVRGLEFAIRGRGSPWADPEEPDFGGLVVTIQRGEG